MLDEFARQDIDALLLKGSAHAFLYADGERMYVDVDILIKPSMLCSAQEALKRLGFSNLYEGAAASEQAAYAETWVRDGQPAVDMHFAFPLVPLPVEEVWAALWSERVRHDVAGVVTNVLARPARLFHVGIHAAMAGATADSAAEDLRRASTLSLEEWRRAHEVARRLCAEAPFAAGLRVHERGREIADGLALPPTSDLRLEVSRLGAPSPAQSLARFLETKTLRDKAALAIRSLFPTPTSLRLTSKVAARGRTGLALAYFLRPLVVARRSPRAAREVLRATSMLRQSRRTHEGTEPGDRSGAPPPL